MSNQKVHFTLSDEALAIIAQRAPSTNKRGEWLSQTVIDYERILSGVDTDSDTGAGLLEQVVNRLARIEKQMVALLAQSKVNP
jgi:hypothetical protein